MIRYLAMLALPHGLVATQPLLHEQPDRLPAEDVAGASTMVPLFFHYSLELKPKMHRVVGILFAKKIPIQIKGLKWVLV